MLLKWIWNLALIARLYHVYLAAFGNRRPQGAAQLPPKGGFDGISIVDWQIWKVLPNSVIQAVKRKWSARMRARTIGGSFKTIKKTVVIKYKYLFTQKSHRNGLPLVGIIIRHWRRIKDVLRHVRGRYSYRIVDRGYVIVKSYHKCINVNCYWNKIIWKNKIKQHKIK